MILKMLENHKNRKTTIRTACNDQVKASRIVYSNLLETVFRSNLNRMNFEKSHNPCLCPLPATKFLAGCIPHIRIDHLSTRFCQGILTCPPSFRLLYTTLPSSLPPSLYDSALYQNQTRKGHPLLGESQGLILLGFIISSHSSVP